MRSGLAVAIALLLALTPALAEAKAGGGKSMGSRGNRTMQSAPATPTAPAAPPVERSITPPGQPSPGPQGQPLPGQQAQPQRPAASPAQTAPGRAPSFAQRNPFMTGLMGGLVGAGLIGLFMGGGLFGSGLGLAGVLGLLLQVALLGGLAWLLFRLVRRARASGRAAAAGAGYAPAPTPLSANDFHRQRQPERPRRPAGGVGPQSGGSDEVGIDAGDYARFETMLNEVQTAWSRRDSAALARLLTPEMQGYFEEQWAADRAKGVVNQVSDVKLLQGDLAEAWREGNFEFATVAMRWQATDVVVDAHSGAQAAAPATAVEHTDVWTFRRLKGGDWLLAAMQ